MRYAILSDIHANKEALERVLADADRCGADEIVCLGDVVGYGPLPKETLALVRSRCAVVIAGNHDDAVSGRGDASRFIDLAGDAIRRHREALDADSITWLKALPYSASLGEALLVHGDATDPAQFFYVESAEDADANFRATDFQLLFVGHTHVPSLFLTGHSGTVYRTDPQDFTLEDGKRYIVNVGSVGYPRESGGQCHSSYVIYDSTERTVSFRFLPFSVASVMQRGLSPKRIGKGVLAAILGAVALLATGAAWLLLPKTEVEVEVEKEVTVTKTEVVEDDPALIYKEATLAVDPARERIKANLRLADKAFPVQLKLVFLDARGEAVDRQSFKVSSHSAKAFDAPANAVSVRITVLKFKADDRPDATFAPEAVPKMAKRR